MFTHSSKYHVNKNNEMDSYGLNNSLKDRLLDNIARSIKRVQEYVFTQSSSADFSGAVVLSNDDVVVQPLFKHLDRLFLSGLKKISVGYWSLAVELSHRETVKELKLLTNITTTIGRGRAWLYHALNENLLECYLKTVEDNEKLVKRFYNKDALFFDQQRMKILITLCSGLECVSFQLDYDVPYLDVDSCLQLNEQDNVSACSTLSQASGTSDVPSVEVSPVSLITTVPMTNSKSGPSSFKGDEIVIPNLDESIEVVRIKTKHKKKKRKKPRAVSIDSENSSRSETIDQLPVSVGKGKEVKPIEDLITETDLSKPLMDLNLHDHSTVSKHETHGKQAPVIIDIGLVKPERSSHQGYHTDMNLDSDNAFERTLREDGEIVENGAALVENLNDSQFSNQEMSIYSKPHNDKDIVDNTFEIVPNFRDTLEGSHLAWRDDSEDGNTSTPVEASGTETEDSSNFSTDISDSAMRQEVSTVIQKTTEPIETVVSPSKTMCVPVDTFHEKAVGVDNNLMLNLMLEVFDSEDEQFHKMYETSQGHAEGNVTPIHVLLTNRSMYLLKPKPSHKYTKYAVISYNEIDYVSLGIGGQIVQIVCTNRRKQFWLTTGSENITRNIIEDLQTAMRLSGHLLPQSNVLTDATTQQIALRKWASQQCRTEISRNDIYSFVLGFWEDRSPGANLFKIKNHKEGVLLYKVHTLYNMGYGAWKPGYFVLSNGILYQYEDKDERHTPNKCIQIGSDECGGCRRSKDSDREHSFEIILSNGSVMHLSAATNVESNEWLQCLCQAVSEGQMGNLHNAVACCMVVTPTTILLCHQDVQTEFFRTIASASIVDITSLAVDPSTNKYFIIDFESQEQNVESEQWAMYLCGSKEFTNLTQSLDRAWSQHFQVSLPLTEIEDVLLKQQCRDTIRDLKGNA